MPCQYPGSTWHPVVIRNASIVNAWRSEIRRTTAKTREDTMTVKVELSTPRRPYLESGPPQVPRYPSMLVREGGIRNFFPNFGIEDRGDSGGVVSPVSKPEALEAQLRKYAAVHV
jgi:hypothetical protein